MHRLVLTLLAAAPTASVLVVGSARAAGSGGDRRAERSRLQRRPVGGSAASFADYLWFGSQVRPLQKLLLSGTASAVCSLGSPPQARDGEASGKPPAVETLELGSASVSLTGLASRDSRG
jgi:hypothetical protein